MEGIFKKMLKSTLSDILVGLEFREKKGKCDCLIHTTLFYIALEYAFLFTQLYIRETTVLGDIFKGEQIATVRFLG